VVPAIAIMGAYVAPLGFDCKQTDSEAVRTISRAHVTSGYWQAWADSKTLEQI
jgi:hypothetical protein